MNKKVLRKGYTTGACAAAASKAAAIAFLAKKKARDVQITLPIGKTITLPVHKCKIEKDRAIASIIKDAGDDPDVTNGAEIVAEFGVQSSELKNTKAFQFKAQGLRFKVQGGKGIGIVTKPGLAVKVGEPAINPVPRKMIKDAIKDVIANYKIPPAPLLKRGVKVGFSIILSIPNGEEIAKKTMNARLGIIGGISILGTTGIVEPLSLSAYRHSITCAMDVATASGCKEIVFSTGRSSEKAVEKELHLPEEAFILIGDHMGFALKKVKGQKSKIKSIVIAGQFGKFSKLASGYFETHCSDSSIELEFLAGLAKKAGAKKNIIDDIKKANTARQVFFILKENGLEKVFKIVCEKVKENSSKIADIKTGCILVGYEGEAVIKI